MLSPGFEKWAQSARNYFRDGGANGNFALDIARLYIALYMERLNPRIARIWSNPSHQMALQKRWDSGDRKGLRARPASNSKHIITGFLGKAAAEAIDMPCDDDYKGAKIATSLGIGAGAGFSSPDLGHYYQLK